MMPFAVRRAVVLGPLLVAIASAPAGAAGPKRADLVVKTVLPPPTTLAAGGRVAIVANVANTGKRKAKATTLAAYLARGPKLTRNDLKLAGSLRVSALKPHQTKTVRGSLAAPSSLPAGSYHLIACADAGKSVKEKDEKNNCRTAALTTMVAAPGGGLPGPGGGDTNPPAGGDTNPPAGGDTTPPGGGGTPPALPGSDKPVPPPPPAPDAPPISSTEAEPMGQATAFLYSGANPVQTGVGAGTIDMARVGVLRGRVLKTDATPLPSVTVTVVDHPELGQTVTRSDGHYDLAVNSGGPLTLRFKRPTYLPVDRLINPPERDYDSLDDIVMTQFDAKVTGVDPGAATAQVAQSDTTTDPSGSRKATLIFMPDTHAVMRLPDGSTKPLDSSMHVRATEYTVGAKGPEAMPGDLPPTSGYTYAVDYSVDEAVEAGATGVQFDKAVAVYTENFLGMPVGSAVPLGSYDTTKQAWIPEPNGRVLKIVSITAGKADLDTDGDGNADSDSSLAALGITDTERAQLASLYPAGTELWRASVTHFSAFDHNWPYGPSPGSTAPNPPPPRPSGNPKDPNDPEDPCKKNAGSSIDCNSRALLESIPVTGTPYTLDYTSDRAAAHAARDIDIPLSGPSVPGSLKRIELAIEVGGQVTHFETSPGPNLVHSFHWDGTDAYGRPLGRTQGTATITYVYPGMYESPDLLNAFARFGGAFTSVPSRGEVRLSTRYGFVLGRATPPPSDLGGWTLDVHHALDTADQSVQLGTGGDMPAPAQNISRRFVDSGATVDAAAWMPDGSVWYAQQEQDANGPLLRIHRRAPDGTLTTIGTIPRSHVHGFGSNVMVPARGGGAWVLANIDTPSNGPIWHVAADGNVTPVTAGDQDNPQPPTAGGGDGQPASQVLLGNPNSMDTGPDGSLYVGEVPPGASGESRVVRIRPDGILENVYTLPPAEREAGVSVSPDGSLYVLRSGSAGGDVIDRVFPSGDVRTVLGGGAGSVCCETGQSATSVHYNRDGPLDIGPDGRVYFSDGSFIDVISGDGKIAHVAGFHGFPPGAQTDPPALASIISTFARKFDVARDGRILIGTRGAGLRSIQPGVPGFSLEGYAIPSGDQKEVYRFDTAGRHLKTVDSLTGVTDQAFDYDSAGRLKSVADRDGRATTIERDADGKPTAIVSPTGERTTLALDADGNLASVAGPGNLQTQLTYKAGGLLTGETDAGGGVHAFAYDDNGFVTRDTDPDGVATDVSVASIPSGHEVTLTEPSGRTLKIASSGSVDTGWTRKVTDPAGGHTTTTIGPDGSITATLSDGRTANVTFGADPRFGALARHPVDTTVKEPSGLTFDLPQTYDTTLTDPTDLFSVATTDDTFRVGPFGERDQRHYDGATRALTITDTANRVASETFDAAGRMKSLRRDGSEDPFTTTVDTRGRPTHAAQGAESGDFTYDGHDRLASRSDALGHTTHYTYDAAGRVASTQIPGGQTYHFEHNGIGRLTKLTMPSGAVTNLTYTPAGRQKSVVPPGSGTGYVVDDTVDGLPKSTTLPSGRQVQLGRDSADRVTSITYPEATQTATYAGTDGRMASITRTPAGGGTAENLAQAWDGDLLTSSEWSGAAAGRYDFAYDSHFRVSQTKATAGAVSQTEDITRDPDGLVTGQGPFSLTRGGPRGGISAISDGTLALAQTWDNLGRLASRTDNVNGADRYKMEISRDAAGHLTHKVETIAGTAHTFDYDYDADGRLTDVHRDGTLTEHYAYDADGNRTTRNVNGSNRTATYDAAGKLTAVGATNYTVNNDGFVTARGADTFTYSTRAELLSATVGGTTETYTYDGLGRLVARTVSGQTWRYLYGNVDQELQVTAAVEPDGTLDTLDYTDTGFLFSILRGSTRYYVSTDTVGSPRMVSDANGNAVKTVSYSAYGEVVSDSAPSFVLPIGYAGGVSDPVAGLVHMGLRNYDPLSGRFTSRDSLGLGGGAANLFEYAAGNPITLSDPAGMASGSLTACNGLCVGTKLTWSDKGISACLEVGFGEGVDVEFDPLADPDDNKVYDKLSVALKAGPLAGAELSGEISSDGNCPKKDLGLKVCVLGACVTQGQGLSVDPKSAIEALKKAADVGFEAKLASGICQNALW